MDIDTSKNFLNQKSITNDLLFSLIRDNEKIVLLTHINPDGDAIGSQYAMMEYCLRMGKMVRAFIPNEFPSNLTFINPEGYIIEFDGKMHSSILLDADLIIILDLNDSHRVGKIEEFLLSSKAKKVLIDHHLEPKDFCDYYIVNFDAASTGQLVYEFLKDAEAYKMSDKSAQALYTAIMTDTGSFRFPKTDAYIHRITAELIEAGANPTEAYDKVYNSFPMSAMKLRAVTYGNIDLLKKDTVCISFISRADFKNCAAHEEETEGLVESLLAIDGVGLAALLIESPERDEIRCSFRAKNEYEVRSMAVAFGGGGHAQAAGARIHNTSLDSAVQMVVEHINKNTLMLKQAE